MGWVRAWAYLRTVLREIPSWREISRREVPWTLACCTAFQRASCRGVSSRRAGGSSMPSSLTGPSTTGAGSKLANRRSWCWLRPCLPRRFTMRPISGVGANAP